MLKLISGIIFLVYFEIASPILIPRSYCSLLWASISAAIFSCWSEHAASNSLYSNYIAYILIYVPSISCIIHFQFEVFHDDFKNFGILVHQIMCEYCWIRTGSVDYDEEGLFPVENIPQWIWNGMKLFNRSITIFFNITKDVF